MPGSAVARRLTGALLLALAATEGGAAPAVPVRGRGGMVVSQSALAAEVGAAALADGGSAVDAAVATALALAVVHPSAGNLGGGGFLLLRSADGGAAFYDFRERAPAGAHPGMFLVDGVYDEERHHHGHAAVGVPGTVAGLHLAWREHGRLPWRRLVEPAIALARRGFPISHALATSLAGILPEMKRRGYRAAVSQFSKDGEPYAAGEWLRQPELGRTFERIAERGPADFYRGETARLIVAEMEAGGGLIGAEDLASYRPVKREPVRGEYRGVEVLSAPPPSSGGTALVEMLNVLEGYDLAVSGPGSAATLHLLAESMRRAYADRARYLGDPEANPGLPLERLLSVEHAAALRATIDPARASVSSPGSFEWPAEGEETTHLSVVDRERNAVALTTTLEQGYGSRIAVAGAGFLLNNEMGDFNAGPGLTDAKGRIGTGPNLARPGARMLSSMTPTILARGGRPLLVVGSLGGRRIINVVLQIVLNVVDFGMNVREAIDAPRMHHQWLPDRIAHERLGFSPDTLALLAERGHALHVEDSIGVAEGIAYDAEADLLEGGVDGRSPDGGAATAAY